LGAYNSNNQLVPWYTIDPDNSSVSDYIVSPSGRAITADINYLKLSKTKLLDGYQVSRLKPTLFKKILIVPEKYKHYEAKIRSNYLTEFLFQLNSDFKEWKRTEHTPKFTRKNLKIEIIYAKNGQKYFTYNPNSGDNLATNMVKDPIITVFDGYQNSLSYGNLFALNGGFFFFDRHVGEAYERIQPLLRKSGMGSTINYVTSIYAQKSKLIQQTKNAANTALTQIVVFGIITFLSLAVLINQYYLLREKEIIIKRFMGFPLRTIMFIPVAFISIVFILSNVISIYLAHTIDWLSLSESALIFLGTILMSFIIVLYDIKKRNRTIGRDS
jgi:putative ABC transport system permease protein